MGANDYLDDGLAAQLVSLFRHSRVLDLGCGLGHYGHYLQARVRRMARVCQANKIGLCLAMTAVFTLSRNYHCHCHWQSWQGTRQLGVSACVMGSLRAWAQGIEWTGYDGAENIELATDDVHFADLTVPQWFGRKYDWVLSLEVRSAGRSMQLAHASACLTRCRIAPAADLLDMTNGPRHSRRRM